MDIDELDSDPILQFGRWLAEAEESSPWATAMTLATATRDGRPSARMVLLRGADERGFVFFSNRESRKGLELAENPHAALVFHWWGLGRQVRVEGRVEQIAASESEEYWAGRPHASRLSAWASPQSRALGSRRELDELYAKATRSFADGDVPRPPFWGGYRVVPEAIEFWAHRDDRLHDRIRYRLANGGWTCERLAP